MSCQPSPRIGICGRCGQKDFLGADGDCHPDFYTNCYKQEKDSKMRRNYQPEVENSMLYKAFSAGYSVGQTDAFGLVKAAEVLKNAFRFWLEEFTHDPDKEHEICPRCGVDANHCADFCDTNTSRRARKRHAIGTPANKAKVERPAPQDSRSTE